MSRHPGWFTDSGLFLALEGGEGAGKSTQARRLADWLRAAGHDVVLTREPGGTAVGSSLRRLVLDPATGELSPRTEALIYAADKAEHVDAVLVPVLAAGAVVVTDRYVDSTLAYQGAGRSLRMLDLEPVARWATRDLRPHLSVLLDVDPRTGTGRFRGRDRLEAEPMDFHDRVRQGFLDLAAADPAHYLVLDAAGDVDELTTRIRSRVQALLVERPA